MKRTLAAILLASCAALLGGCCGDAEDQSDKYTSTIIYSGPEHTVVVTQYQGHKYISNSRGGMLRLDEQ